MTLEASALTAFLLGQGWVRLPPELLRHIVGYYVTHPTRRGLVRLDGNPWDGALIEQRQTAARAGAEMVRAARQGREPDPAVMAGDVGAVFTWEG